MGSPQTILPRVFLGSSKENIKVARAIQVNLDDEAETSVWDQGVFDLSRPAFTSLVEKANTFDFAVFIFAPEDKLIMRGEILNSTRDNVVFELGLFIGCLGADRTFIVAPRGVDLHLPTDLLGITYALYQPERRDRDLEGAVGAACTKIKSAMQMRGLRQPTQNQVNSSDLKEDQQKRLRNLPVGQARGNSKAQSQLVKQPTKVTQACVPDASGKTITVGTEQHSSIQAAIRAARSGDTVLVPRGTYHEKLVLRKGIRLIGENRNNTIVCFDGLQDSTLTVPTDATGLVENITFAHLGEHNTSKAYSVVTLIKTKVVLRRCRVIDGICYGITSFSGDQALIEECEIMGNGCHGIIVYNQSTHTTIRANDIHHNMCGIWFSWDGGGLAENNHCHDNEESGIVVTNDATPNLQGNRCENNLGYGIWVDALSEPIFDGVPNILNGNGKGGARPFRDGYGPVDSKGGA